MNTLSVKLSELAINPASPWDDDTLKRRPMADALTNLIVGEPNPLVITVNGSWGSGKTFMLKRWAAQLKVDGHTAIYFSAWENDHCGDPLIAIIGELWSALKESDTKEILKRIKESASGVITDTMFNAIRAGTVGLVDFQPENLKSVAEKAVDAYGAEQENKAELKQRLSELAEQVAKTESGCPLVFIVDELDRCRPTYAIELLERVKHLFNIPHMVFVLGIDRVQLASSIKAVYGNVDADGYLRRFFDLEFNLPPADFEAYCTDLMNRHGLEVFFRARMENFGERMELEGYRRFIRVFPPLCKRFQVSLRDTEQFIRTFVLVAKTLEERAYYFPDLLGVLLLLRYKEHELYLEFVQGRCFPGKVLDTLEQRYEGDTAAPENAQEYALLEETLYLASFGRSSRGKIVVEQLELLSKGEEPTRPECLSKRLLGLNRGAAKKFYEECAGRIGVFGAPSLEAFEYLVSKIELVTHMVKS